MSSRSWKSPAAPLPHMLSRVVSWVAPPRGKARRGPWIHTAARDVAQAPHAAGTQRPGRHRRSRASSVPARALLSEGVVVLSAEEAMRLGWWGLGLGIATGVGDVAFGLWLGLDFRMAERDVTLPVAAFLASGYAALGFCVGYLLDARARARRDADTIRAQLRALEESQRRAAQNEKLAAIGRLAAGVAHEVRNPLGVIRASAAMLQEGFEPGEEPHRACRFICEETDRLNGLITSLLGFARPTEPRLQTLSIEKVLDRALALGAGELERRRVGVARRVAPGLPE